MAPLSIVPLPTEAMRPLPDESLKERVILAALAMVADSPLAKVISPAKLRSVLDQRFDRFCDGRYFDFEPLTRGLLREGRVSEAECWFGFVELVENLRPLGIVVKVPPFELSDELRARIARTVKQRRAGGASSRLGELLLRHKLISEAQLEEALRAQASFGGKLGSHLVKLGYVQESALAHFLGAQRNLPSVHGAMVSSWIDALQLIPAELAKKYKVLPIELKHGALRLAMSDPANRAAIREIATRTGYRVVPVIAPEIMIEELLGELLGNRAARPKAIDLAKIDLDTGEFQVVHTSERRKSKPPPAPEAPSKNNPSITVEDRGEFFKSERADLHADQNVGELSAELTKAFDESAILWVATKMIGTRFAKTVAFTAREKTITGAAQIGFAISEEDLRAIAIPLAECSLFRDLTTVSAGGYAATALDVTLLGWLGIPDSAELVRIAIGQGGKHIGFILATQPKDRSATRDAAFFQRVSDKAAMALEIVALRQKVMAR